MKNVTVILASLIMLLSPVAAQDLKVFEFPPTAADIRLVEQGSPQAQVKLGRDYQDVNDYNQAFKWYKLAAEQSYARAQLNLGLMYSHGGMGVRQDYTLAYMWLNIGAANGSSAAKRWRKKVAGNMTPQAIEKAQSLAKRCIKTNYKKCG